jgi:HEAT repeat protein
VSLQALGNAGGEAALAPAELALADADPGVRAAGVSALRFAPAPRADAIQARVWREDQAASVRAAVTTTAGFRPPGPALLGAGIAVLLGDPDARVRMSVLPYLGQLRDHDPRITPAMETAMNNDASSEVREAAAQALGQPTGRNP